MKTPFDEFFDFDNDGELDLFEEASATAMFLDVLEEDEKRQALEEAGLDPDDFDELDD